jgi:small-conductance mechanosensitive channel
VPTLLGVDEVDRVRGVMVEALRSTEGLLAEPAPDVLLMNPALSSVNLRVPWRIAPPRHGDALDARDQVLATVKHQRTAQGIDPPFPTQQILVHDQTEESDGDQAGQREEWPTADAAGPESRKVADTIGLITMSNPQRVDGA